jgi:hypothetical protein
MTTITWLRLASTPTKEGANLINTPPPYLITK